ncbi:hypothetical protein PC116_g34635 [Phytophthora cactorum]|nr:hypothetical protein PC116_g34635 [Phytophthora cactorum]
MCALLAQIAMIRHASIFRRLAYELVSSISRGYRICTFKNGMRIGTAIAERVHADTANGL